MKFQRLSILPALFLATAGYADVAVFMTTGEHGEASFSDVVSTQAVEIHLPEFHQPSPSSKEQVRQMLEVADALAAAREQREQRREARRQRAVNLQKTQQQYSTATTRSSTWIAPWWPAPPHHPAPPSTPTEPVAQKSFKFTPKL